MEDEKYNRQNSKISKVFTVFKRCWKVLFGGGFVVAVITSIIPIFVERVLPPPTNNPSVATNRLLLDNDYELSEQCPNLDFWSNQSDILAKPDGMEIFLPTTTTEGLPKYRIFIDNEDNRELRIIDFFVEVLDYYTYDNLEGSIARGRGGVHDYLYYRSDIEGKVGKYPAYLCKDLSKIDSEQFKDFQENPEKYKRGDGIYVSIDGLSTQGFEIYFSVKDAGVYKTRVSINYMLGGQKKTMNTTENIFLVISVDELDNIIDSLY